ncbi:MAG: hypothetical protein ACYTGL_27580 [Planctomycetota bacterium]|jgi:hypothetical protein
MDSAADHEYIPRNASPALKAAIAELARQTGRPESDFDSMRLGDVYQLAVKAFGENLPEFWRVWNSWNQESDTPAAWGDL